MTSNDATFYYGIFVGAIQLCIAAEAFIGVQPQLDFFKLLKLRISNHSLSFNMDAVSISKLPQDVWERVKLELVRVGLEEAEISLSKEAAVELREGTLLNFVGKDEPFKWSEEMYSDDFDWEKFVEETGGALGTFKEAKGAVVTVKNHVEDIRTLLNAFGLLLPSTQTFKAESGKSKPLLLPIAFPLPPDASKNPSTPIDIAESQERVPFPSNPRALIPTILMFSDFTTPVRRDTSPSTVTQPDIYGALLTNVPEVITKRFKRLEHLYGLSRLTESGNDENNRSKERYLLLKV